MAKPGETPGKDPENLRPKSRELAPYCLLCALLRVFTIILIAIGILVLILWLVFQPDNIKVYVDDASLARFHLDANNTLYYDLSLNISLRNPNKKIGVHYERMGAVAGYNGVSFGQDDVARFHQRRKSTEMLKVRFRGEGVLIGSGVAERYEKEKSQGWFSVNVKMYTRVRLKVVVANSIVYSPDVDCGLKIPAPTNGDAGRGFETTECNVQSFS